MPKFQNHALLRPPYRRAAYQRGVALILEASEILAGVKTVNWTQAVVLNEVYLKLTQSAEALFDVSPNDLAVETRQRIGRGLE